MEQGHVAAGGEASGSDQAHVRVGDVHHVFHLAAVTGFVRVGQGQQGMDGVVIGAGSLANLEHCLPPPRPPGAADGQCAAGIPDGRRPPRGDLWACFSNVLY